MGSKRTARREFLKSGAALAGGFTLGSVTPRSARPGTASVPAHDQGGQGQIAYGDRSKYVTSVRIPHGGTASPDNFGLTFHVAAPLQDSVGVITPSSLHYVRDDPRILHPGHRSAGATPDDPRPVDRPLTFTMEDLKRLPSVTRLHFIECAGNGSSRRREDRSGNARDDELRQMDRRAPLPLLKECGLKGAPTWFVAEGTEEVKGASSMPIAKAMDDCIVAYGMNGEAVRPQNGFPLRLMVPGFEGFPHEVPAANQARRSVLHELQRLRPSRSGRQSRGARLPDRAQVGHHVSFRRTTAARQGVLRDQRPGLVRGRRHQAGGGVHRQRQEMEQGGDQGNATADGPYPFRLSVELGRKRDGLMSRCTDEIGQVQPTRAQVAEHWNKPYDATFSVPGWTTACSPGGSPGTGA